MEKLMKTGKAVISGISGAMCTFSLLGLGFIGFILGASGQSPAPVSKKTAAARNAPKYYALIETDKGSIEIQLFPNDAPKAVRNFRFLALGHHYDGLTFHRIIKGFMIQGGDPKGDGTGGESIWGGPIEDEINPSSPLYQQGYRRGIVAMANAGPNTNGSQFFIMHKDYPLPPKYVIIGQVIRGLEVVDALAQVPTEVGADGNSSKPVSPVIMRKVSIQSSRSRPQP